MVAADPSVRLYSERLTPSLPVWLIAIGVGVVFFVMFLPASTAA